MLDLEAVWREARINLSQAWTWVKDDVAEHPVLILLAILVIVIIWRLLRPVVR
jgi:hypothetical protein